MSTLTWIDYILLVIILIIGHLDLVILESTCIIQLCIHNHPGLEVNWSAGEMGEGGEREELALIRYGMLNNIELNINIYYH